MASTLYIPRSPSVSGSLGLPLILGIAGVTILLAIFFGLIAVSANIILVALSVGLIVGALLVVRPGWNIWLILSMGLLVAGVLPIWVDFIATKAVWGISILGFVLLASALFKLIGVPGVARNTPAFIWAALIFLFFVVVGSLAQWHGAGEFLSGFKRYFQMWGLMFALCWLSIDERDIRRWRGFLLVAALVQLPFAVYELIKLVPLREGYASSMPGLVPIDVVAGTFGSYLYAGGASAEMATFLIIVLGFLLARKKEKQLSAARLFLLAPLVIAPLFLGETKVVVILLPLMFLVLYRREMIARPHYALAALAMGAVFTIAAGYAYSSLSKKSLDQQVADILDYNVYDRGYGNSLLNRTTVLTFWAEKQDMQDPISMVFGNGVGSAQSGATLAPGHIGMRYERYGIGLTAASTLLWETGLFGFGLFLLTSLLAWRTAGRLIRSVTDPLVRADLIAIQAAIAIFTFYLFYELSVLQILGFQIVFVSLLGYLAWLYRKYGPA
ncbi:hypothetical protein [Thiobacillus sedimenti]|uniref:O-antigen ligase domain-containing protein n=1 Tax=Thiobacillus sedimenti TaxID=3110231 RepID=A0ABZ1CGH0_9PROT|nr:hypothetical protein [Thiobacillus sp. SCUT-2]WRS38332.1 hypothetical protein VA613_09970 [Thiobacillus sp. SCUT-2]